MVSTNVAAAAGRDFDWHKNVPGRTEGNRHCAEEAPCSTVRLSNGCAT